MAIGAIMRNGVMTSGAISGTTMDMGALTPLGKDIKGRDLKEKEKASIKARVKVN